jgi:hypothetical protein
MAITTSKVTYSLKPQTVDRVEELAIKWGVPKSEVINRAIDRMADNESGAEVKLTPLQALERLQKNGISPQVAAKWNTEIRQERRAWGRKKR